jgi:hypothetical protein
MIRLTEKQKEQLEKMAKKAKLGVAPFVRATLFDKTV